MTKGMCSSSFGRLSFSLKNTFLERPSQTGGTPRQGAHPAPYHQLPGTGREFEEEGRHRPKTVRPSDVRLASHKKYLGNHQEDLKQIVEDQVCMVNRMMGYEEKACQCGEDSGRLSQLSYGEPPVASSSGPSFPSEGSPQPIPVPLLAAVVADPEFPYLHRVQVTLIRRIATRGPSSPLSKP